MTLQGCTTHTHTHTHTHTIHTRTHAHVQLKRLAALSAPTQGATQIQRVLHQRNPGQIVGTYEAQVRSTNTETAT